ncbi:MAG: hypothetical protein IJR49_04620 [Treponema sp.]|nr:hypothetical protein [Treponema sp.]
MAKKSSKSLMGNLYLIGMALTAIGFILPIFKAGPLKVNGFDMVGNGNSIMKLAALLVFIGAIAGVVLNFISVGKNQKMLKLIALVLSVLGGLYCFFNTSDVGIKLVARYLYAGFYLIIAGWIVGVLGYLQGK